jgi:nitrogen fixation NifU-like protein
MNTENDLYQELVLEHKRTPRNFGHLPHPTHQAQGTNPQCGDQVAVELQVQDGRVQDIRFSGQGCAICMASSSMMTEAVKGRDLASAQQLQQHFRAVLTGTQEPDDAALGKLVSLAGVRRYPSRIKCARRATGADHPGPGRLIHAAGGGPAHAPQGRGCRRHRQDPAPNRTRAH